MPEHKVAELDMPHRPQTAPFTVPRWYTRPNHRPTSSIHSCDPRHGRTASNRFHAQHVPAFRQSTGRRTARSIFAWHSSSGSLRHPHDQKSRGPGEFCEGYRPAGYTGRQATAPNLIVVTDVCCANTRTMGHVRALHQPDAHRVPRATCSTTRLLIDVAISHAGPCGHCGAQRHDEAAWSGHPRRTRCRRIYSHIPIMSYAVKYASSFYGPFHDRTTSTPCGNRETWTRPMCVKLRKRRARTSMGADLPHVKPSIGLSRCHQPRSRPISRAAVITT